MNPGPHLGQVGQDLEPSPGEACASPGGSAMEAVPLSPVLAAGCRAYRNKFVVWKGSSQSSITHGESSLSSHHTLEAAPYPERVLEAGQGSAPASQILP